MKDELLNYMNERKTLRNDFPSLPHFVFDGDMIDMDDEDEKDDVERRITEKSKAGSSKAAQKRPREKDSMDNFLVHPPEKAAQFPKMKKTTIRDACDKETRQTTCQYIARFYNRAGIPLNAVRYKEFDLMIDSIGRHGSDLKPPSFHEMRVPLLRKEVENTNDMMTDHQE